LSHCRLRQLAPVRGARTHGLRHAGTKRGCREAVRAYRRPCRPQSEDPERSGGCPEPPHRDPAAEADAIRRLFLPCLALGPATLLPAWDARAQEGRPPPFELARTLRSFQDRIAAGDSKAFFTYRTELASITDLIGQADGGAWSDPRNVRAAVAVVLSGG